MKKLFFFFYLSTTCVFSQGTTYNFVDANGLKQGKWVLLGKDLPETGVESDAIAEEGTFQNGQKTGAWVRYDKSGKTPISLMLFTIDATGQSKRIGLYGFKYHDNGSPAYVPYAGQSTTKANYKRFNSNGLLVEQMEYDSLGNEAFSIAQIDSSSLAELPYFQLPENFQKKAEVGNLPYKIPNEKTMNGYYIVDYNHSFFISGLFQNGILVKGNATVLDETMQIQWMKEIANGKLVASFQP